MLAPQSFDGRAMVMWTEPDVTVAVPWYMGLMFRTRHSTGTLMQANAGQASKINLLVREWYTHTHTHTHTHTQTHTI